MQYHVYHKPGSPRQDGFSLIELVTIIVVISALIVVAAFNWPGKVLNLDAQAYQLASDIRYTQSLSMTRGQRFRIDMIADRYTLQDQGGATYAHPVAGASAVLLDTGITLSPNSLLVFDGKGVPYTVTAIPGTPMAADVTIVLSGGGETRQLLVSAQTGRVQVQ